jgi:hypothetical protein
VQFLELVQFGARLINLPCLCKTRAKNPMARSPTGPLLEGLAAEIDCLAVAPSLIMRCRKRRASTWGAPGPEKMDINTTAYMVAIKIGDKHSFSKVLSELVANQDALRPDVRRFLVKRLHLCAEGRRRQAQLELAAANHWDAVANQFKEDEDVTPQPPPPAWLNRQANEPADI